MHECVAVAVAVTEAVAEADQSIHDQSIHDHPNIMGPGHMSPVATGDMSPVATSEMMKLASDGLK